MFVIGLRYRHWLMMFRYARLGRRQVGSRVTLRVRPREAFSV